MGDEYTIADIATFPVVRNLVGYYDAGELVRIGDFPQVTRALDGFVARPAVARGLRIPAERGAFRAADLRGGLPPDNASHPD
jgi:GST-like protein